jgi:hypothetical protein
VKFQPDIPILMLIGGDIIYGPKTVVRYGSESVENYVVQLQTAKPSQIITVNPQRKFDGLLKH